MTHDDIRRAALLSADGVYRYSLTRDWGRGPRLLWVCLNPSVADHAIDDPTIRRLIGFAKQWHLPGIEVVNLFALRATNPAELKMHKEPIGELNDLCIRQGARDAGRIVAAWGAHPFAARRIKAVRELIPADQPVYCLGKTKTGQPRHPLYVKADTELTLL